MDSHGRKMVLLMKEELLLFFISFAERQSFFNPYKSCCHPPFVQFKSSMRRFGLRYVGWIICTVFTSRTDLCFYCYSFRIVIYIHTSHEVVIWLRPQNRSYNSKKLFVTVIIKCPSLIRSFISDSLSGRRKKVRELFHFFTNHVYYPELDE